MAGLSSAGGSPFGGNLSYQPQFTAGHLYSSCCTHTTHSHGTGSISASPLWLPTCTLDLISIEVTTGVATAVYRLGIYANKVNAFYPGRLIGDYGTVDCSTTGGKTIAISQQITEGWYWPAGVSQTAACTVRASNTVVFPLATAFVGEQAAGFFSTGGITGALPDPAADFSGYATPCIRIWVRRT